MIVGGDTWAIEAVRTVDAGVAAWKDESCHPFGSGREAKRFARETARRLFSGVGRPDSFQLPTGQLGGWTPRYSQLWKLGNFSKPPT